MFENRTYVYEERSTNFLASVYLWMCAALAVTAATAWYVASTEFFLQYVMQQPILLLVVFIAQLGLVVALSALLHKINYITAIILFMLYAISMGFTMSLIISTYTLASIASTFVVTSGMFGGMALYGYMTRSDLSKVNNIAIMILLGLMLAMIVNFFLKSMWFDYAISMVGVVIFALLTAADTQKIKMLGERLVADRQTKNKASLLGALTLYLDFLNLFLFLLRFTGNRRNQ